ncbi:hypothetical protein DPEC_G00077480, partial [Dallia pectoralis]
MSSEDKSLDASDRGPSPPLSSTGGGSPSDSTSPAPTDRRPRGRPRKDAGYSMPTRAPTTKPQKKGRGRARVQVNDEDSMEGTEYAGAENTQEMEAKDLVMEVEENMVSSPLPSPTSSPLPSPTSSPLPSPTSSPLPSPTSSPLPSPTSSPLPSPSDDRTLFPLFQRSVSEDSAGSSASALEHAKVREKLCAFCYCGKRSFLGQGDLMVFGPTPGYVPLHIRNRRGSSEKDDDYHEDDFQEEDHDTKSPGLRNAGRGLKKVSSPDSGLHSSSAPGSTDPFGEEPARKFWELGEIGLPDDIN